MGEYFRNMETNKLELHFSKEEYAELPDETKREIRSNFLFSRKAQAWVSRCKFPNLWRAEQVAKKIGLEDAGQSGEKLTFAEMQEKKAERAENRAARYDVKSERAITRGEELQKPIRDMHGDIAFFTQPNINSSAGRAFTRRRQRMFNAFDRGFEEFKKSEYYKKCAETARRTAAQAKKPSDKGFCQRRIDEAEASIRGLKRSITEYEGYKTILERGEIPKDKFGYELKNLTIESVTHTLDRWYEIMEDEIQKAVYYRECIEDLGGILFTRENLNKGDIIEIPYFGGRKILAKIIRFGTKNVTYQEISNDDKTWLGKISYAEIIRVVKPAS